MSESSGPTLTPPAFSTIPLTLDELVMCRRFMGYMAIGSDTSGLNTYRFFAQYGFNEWKMANLSPSELAQCRSYMSRCQTLEAAIDTASDNLDTDKAAVWVHNKNEIDDRIKLFNYVRRQLCAFFGIPPGDGVTAGNSPRIIN